MRYWSTARLQSLTVIAAFVLAACAASGGNQTCRKALEAAEVQLDGFRRAYTDPTRIPRSWDNGKTRLVDSGDWTSGFVAGSYRYMFEFTQDQTWRHTAEDWTAALESQQHNTSTHDIGFIIFNSFGNGARLAGDSRYASVLIQAAESLLTRYDADVGAIRSWDFGEWNFPVIIDNMMNLELLYVATELTGDQGFADVATRHAQTTLQNHFRDDYSSFHVVDFDGATGAVIAKQTHQGVSDSSSWSRGQAWGLYGFTMVYRFTRKPEYLELAQGIAEFYLNHAHLPDDLIPYFDFDAPEHHDIDNIRDSSAAAITASALLELTNYVPAKSAARYRDAARAMLRSLASPAYSAVAGGNGHFLLAHATGRWQANDEVDVAINYADYYYLEALMRCVGTR